MISVQGEYRQVEGNTVCVKCVSMALHVDLSMGI